MPLQDTDPTPSFGGFGLKRLARLFDKVAHEEFERLPGMALCPARRSLDDGIARILDLPDLGKLREMLASEPVVSNRRL